MSQCAVTPTVYETRRGPGDNKRIEGEDIFAAPGQDNGHDESRDSGAGLFSVGLLVPGAPSRAGTGVAS